MHTVCAGATNRSAGVRRSKNCVERLMPALHAGVQGERLQRPAPWARAGAFSAGAPGSTSAPVSNADATAGELSLSALMPGRSSANRRGAVAEEAPDSRRRPDQGVEGGRRLRDRLLDVRARHRGEGAEGGVEGDEHLGLGLGDRRHLGGGVGERAEEAPHPGLRRGEVASHRHEAVDQGAQLAEGHVQVGPAAGQRVAEGDQVALGRRPRGRVEDVEELVDLDRLRRGRP